jgi:hypothetical protein
LDAAFSGRRWTEGCLFVGHGGYSLLPFGPVNLTSQNLDFETLFVDGLLGPGFLAKNAAANAASLAEVPQISSPTLTIDTSLM